MIDPLVKGGLFFKCRGAYLRPYILNYSEKHDNREICKLGIPLLWNHLPAGRGGSCNLITFAGFEDYPNHPAAHKKVQPQMVPQEGNTTALHQPFIYSISSIRIN